jgi:hypothetical protein
MTDISADSILRSRSRLPNPYKAGLWVQRSPEAAEGGCGVLGFASNVPVAGRHVLTASQQMHNRGNGKGGGIAMVGLDPVQARVDQLTLQSHYLLQLALLDPSARQEIEQEFIQPNFDVTQAYELTHLEDHRTVAGLDIHPPDVWRYFSRVKPGVLARFAEEHALTDLPRAPSRMSSSTRIPTVLICSSTPAWARSVPLSSATDATSLCSRSSAMPRMSSNTTAWKTPLHKSGLLTSDIPPRVGSGILEVRIHSSAYE